MPMNRVHRWLCNSDRWARAVEQQLLPWALEDVELGEDALEIGPGYGATTRVLVRKVPKLSVIEVDGDSARRLRAEYAGRPDGVEVVHGDGADMPLPEGRYTAVTCFTMLHHVPSPALQDRVFAEARRVLRPGGVFAGCDGLTSWGFRALHIGDTCVPVPPDSMARRLRAAGFADAEVTIGKGSFRFRAW
ncbi:class I SAM-dependent methyltransferase [Streptomyces zagrosensis]|uniref:SAM-dependent methyltransferase n=1 Tax=Streptomyces zagrosensis TaxID=1042984 RepID=A0A7W9QF73_9ACTN|nr:class I SAM-dependent methyltransferase [Streptomyces zagrosensis]MBB5939176.1 SAM-dependent methyltransferase [Streptomyces zagrosensis]